MKSLSEIERQLTHLDDELRRDAVLSLQGRALQESGETVRLLLKAMQDPNWRIRKEAADILFHGYEPDSYIDGAVRLLYIENNAGARNTAIELLVRMGHKATATLIAAFKTDNVDVRKFVIDIIGEVSDRTALDMLIGALNDEDENVKASAVEHLGSMKESSVIDALLGILEKGELWTAYPAVEALGRIEDPRAIPALLEALKKKTLREPTVRALGRIAGEAVLEHIVPFIEGGSRSVRQETVSALATLYHRGVPAQSIERALLGAFGQRAVELLTEIGEFARDRALTSTILMLGILKDSRAIKPLVLMSREDDYTQDVKRALVLIGKGSPEALLPYLGGEDSLSVRSIGEVAAELASPVFVEPFLRMLDNDDGHVRSVAAAGLASIGDARAVKPLLKRLDDPYPDVQSSIVKALVLFKDYIDEYELVEVARSHDPILRKNSLPVLCAKGTARAIEIIGFCMKDEDPSVRKAAVEALSKFKTHSAFHHLEPALTDEEPDIRMAAANALGQMGNINSIETLALLLDDDDTMVRVTAIKAMQTIGNRTAVSKLAPLLTDYNGFVVTTALEVLSTLGGQEARAALVQALDSEDTEVRRTAIRGLANFPGSEQSVLPYLNDTDWATRMAAMESLGGCTSDLVKEGVLQAFKLETDPIVKKTMESYLDARP